LIFLTPDGRISKTSLENNDCPCIEMGYESLIFTLDKIGNEENLFLSILSKHLKKLTKFTTMENNIKNLVKKLYADPNHRNAIKLLGQNTPNISNLFAELDIALSTSTEFHKVIRSTKIHSYIYGTSEYKIYVESLQNSCGRKNIYVNYMLHYNKVSNKSPEIGDEFVVRIMLEYEDLKTKSTSEKQEIRNVILGLVDLGEEFGDKKHWWNWINIRVGESYKLVDMGEKDIEGMSKLLIDEINKTYLPLQESLKKIAKKRKI
jgi:hypothetical protein